MFVPAKSGNSQLNVSLYYGRSARAGNALYNSFDLMLEKYHSTCTKRTFSAYGLRYDDFGDKGYALSVKYLRPLSLDWATVLIPFAALSPGINKLPAGNRLFIKPEVGLRLSTPKLWREQWINLCLVASYGYNIPLMHSDHTAPGRHDVSLRIGIAFNTLWMYRKLYLKKHPLPPQTQS